MPRWTQLQAPKLSTRGVSDFVRSGQVAGDALKDVGSLFNKASADQLAKQESDFKARLLAADSSESAGQIVSDLDLSDSRLSAETIQAGLANRQKEIKNKELTDLSFTNKKAKLQKTQDDAIKLKEINSQADFMYKKATESGLDENGAYNLSQYTDSEGNPLRKEAITQVKSRLTQDADFKARNLATHKAQQKKEYLTQVDEVIQAGGDIYSDDGSLDVTKLRTQFNKIGIPLNIADDAVSDRIKSAQQDINYKRTVEGRRKEELQNQESTDYEFAISKFRNSDNNINTDEVAKYLKSKDHKNVYKIMAQQQAGPKAYATQQAIDRSTKLKAYYAPIEKLAKAIEDSGEYPEFIEKYTDFQVAMENPKDYPAFHKILKSQGKGSLLNMWTQAITPGAFGNEFNESGKLAKIMELIRAEQRPKEKDFITSLTEEVYPNGAPSTQYATNNNFGNTGRR